MVADRWQEVRAMMRLRSLALSLLLLAPVSCSPTRTPSSWPQESGTAIAVTSTPAPGGAAGTARLDHTEFTFDYPADWLNRADRYPSYVGHYPEFDTDELALVSGAPASFWVGRRDLPSGTTLEELFRQLYDGMKDKGLILKAISEETRPVDGQEALGITYEQFWGEPLVRQRDLWLEKEGRAYVLSCRAHPGDFEEAIALCDGIVATFHLK
jgi:hypothetical protein